MVSATWTLHFPTVCEERLMFIGGLLMIINMTFLASKKKSFHGKSRPWH